MYFECPVPKEDCCGSLKQVEPGNRMTKVHISQQEVKKCITRYLIKSGYTNMGNRQFSKEGSPILVLSKKSGMRLRKGKGGSQGKGQSNARFMANDQRKAMKAF